MLGQTYVSAPVIHMEPQDDPRFLKGIEEFNQELFFECHETLEDLWLEERGEDRRFYQAIIQIAAGYYKLQQGVPVGALKLWRTGLEKLVPYEPVFYGVNVTALLEAVRGNLKELEADQQKGAEAFNLPTIHLIC
jgi:predicted metal-dependent hydrolase